MTDDEIISTLHKYFTVTGTITIQDGLIKCTGDVGNKIWVKSSNNQLPVKFKSVDGSFYCTASSLQSLKGAPELVGKRFHCWQNKLESLEGAPKIVGGYFGCSHNQLRSLVGAPQYVGGDFNCTLNPLESLKGAPMYVGGEFTLTYYPNLPLLPLLMIKGCTGVKLSENLWHPVNQELAPILKRYLGTGTQGMLACAEEMHEAGYGRNARYD